jgi:hypothetical protein
MLAQASKVCLGEFVVAKGEKAEAVLDVKVLKDHFPDSGSRV